MTKRQRGQDGFIKAGEIPLMKQLAKKFAPPTKAQLELGAAAAAIRVRPGRRGAGFYGAAVGPLHPSAQRPRRLRPSWLRRTGNSSLIIQPGWDGEADKTFGYPYGSIPRLLLFWITTEVQHTKNRDDLSDLEKRTLQLGRSLNDFMRAVGLNPNTGGGKRGDGKRLHGQMDRLFNSRISFQQTTEIQHLKGRHSLNMEVAPESELWWDVRHPAQGSLWHSWIRLGEDFYKALIALPIPVDMRALRALKRSPLSLGAVGVYE